MANVQKGMKAVTDNFYDEAFQARIEASILAMQQAFPKAQTAPQPSQAKP